MTTEDKHAKHVQFLFKDLEYLKENLIRYQARPSDAHYRSLKLDLESIVSEIEAIGETRKKE